MMNTKLQLQMAARLVKQAARGDQILKLFQRVPALKDAFLNTRGVLRPRLQVADLNLWRELAHQDGPEFIGRNIRALADPASPMYELHMGPWDGPSVAQWFNNPKTEWMDIIRKYRLPQKLGSPVAGKYQGWAPHPRSLVERDNYQETTEHLINLIRGFRRAPSEWLVH